MAKHIIFFYADWCGHCQRMQEPWNKFVATHKSDKSITTEKIESEKIPSKYGSIVNGFPCFAVFVNDKLVKKLEGEQDNLEDLLATSTTSAGGKRGGAITVKFKDLMPGKLYIADTENLKPPTPEDEAEAIRSGNNNLLWRKYRFSNKHSLKSFKKSPIDNSHIFKNDRGQEYTLNADTYFTDGADHKFYEVLNPDVEKNIANKATISVLDSALDKRGIGNDVLKNIMGFAGIKPPPKGARRRTQSHRNRASGFTRRSRGRKTLRSRRR